MWDKLPFLIALGLGFSMVTGRVPAIERIELMAGPQVSQPDGGHPSPIRRNRVTGLTASAATVLSWDVELGVGRSRRGAGGCAEYDVPAFAADGAAGAMMVPPCKAGAWYDSTRDYLDVNLLWRPSVQVGRAGLHLALGGFTGFNVDCGQVFEDTTVVIGCRNGERVAGWLGGTGIDLQITGQLGLAMNLRYGHESGRYGIKSFLGGVVYRVR